MTTSSPGIPVPSDFSYLLRTIAINILSWSLFVVCDSTNKWLIGYYPVIQIIAINTFLGCLLTGGLIFFRHGAKAFITPKLKFHLARGVCFVVSSYCGINALMRIQLADFYGIVFLTPLMIALLAHFILKEKIGVHRAAAIVVGFCGVMVITGAHFHDFNIGYVFSIIAAMSTSISAIFLRKTGKEKTPIIFGFYLFLVAALVFVPLSVPAFVMPHLGHIPVFLGTVLILLVAFTAYAVSYSRVNEAALLAPFHYTQIVWGTLIGFFVFHDVPEPATIAGASIIIGAGLYLVWREHVRHARHTPDSPA